MSNVFGRPMIQRIYRLEQGRAGALSKSKAIDDRNIVTPAGGAP